MSSSTPTGIAYFLPNENTLTIPFGGVDFTFSDANISNSPILIVSANPTDSRLISVNFSDYYILHYNFDVQNLDPATPIVNLTVQIVPQLANISVIYPVKDLIPLTQTDKIRVSGFFNIQQTQQGTNYSIAVACDRPGTNIQLSNAHFLITQLIPQPVQS